ncbi:MAG: hypothetical protein GXP26_15575 [Planctomycetes bacterium]|nr:hypothetical protein [Planctomycetota bacterium]
MNCYLRYSRLLIPASLAVFSLAVLASSAQAHETGTKHLHFQKPSEAEQASGQDAKQPFRAPKTAKAKAKPQRSRKARKIEPVNFEEVVEATRKQTVKRTVVEQPVEPVRIARKKKRTIRRDIHVGPVSQGEIVYESGPTPELEIYNEGCACEIKGDVCEPGCGICEPSCGFAEPGCGIVEPGCGLGEPGCGVADCGGGVSCGSCVGRPGPDYWCFPVCIPRFKDLTVWAGVHGFRGPRDFSPNPAAPFNNRSDSNFGFQEGINISGRAPLIGLLFPQLSYQLGYQAVQSRLSGTVDSPDDRSQQFVTAGLFRRVQTGLQFGVVWDYLRDDLDEEVDFQQIRSEISLKSPRGREIGFFATTSTNSNTINGIAYEATDQFALFFRWNLGNGRECRLWGGATGSSEGIFGGEFYAPLNDRWSLQSSFNYLITDQNAGLAGVSQEGWNIGMNLVWHLGRTARRGSRSPYRPLFAVADNGWMVIDNTTAFP